MTFALVQIIAVIVLGTVILALTGYFVYVRISKAIHLKKFKKEVGRGYADFDKAYQEAYNKLSENRAVIEMIHDWSDDMLGPAGLPYFITDDQAFNIVRQIKSARDLPITMIIHTLGGYSQPTYLIAKALFQHKGGPVTVYVPYLAMSGGTAIALAAPEIVMGDTASLGPIDTQYWGLPIGAFDELEKKKNPDNIDDFFIMLAYVARTFDAGASERAKKYIHANHGPDVAKALIDSRRYHGDGIAKDEALKIGIRIAKDDCPPEVYDLVDAKLRMVAIDRARVAQRELELPVTRSVERTQQLQAFYSLRLKAKRLRLIRDRKTD
jgi:ATP-dependent protease ClpP protease subunit